MSFLRHYVEFAQLLDMSYSPSDVSSMSSSSRESSPLFLEHDRHHDHSEGKDPKPQTSPFLQLPNDLFKCVLDYLDRNAAWSLKRLCRGMASSKAVDEKLYRYPLQLNDVREIRLSDWKYRAKGTTRWTNFKESINDQNRRYVQKIAMSHWCSIADFEWLEANLPCLTSLDISAIKDFVWTPEETWTWKELATACPKLFERLDELEVSNWADYTAHSRIEYSYSYNDYRFKQKFRISRRRDGGSVASMIFPQCKKLKTLAIRERYSGFHTWNEWEVHQRVCCLVDGVSQHCPPTMTKLRVHDYAPYRSLFSTDASAWSNIKEIEIGLYHWMEDRRDRDVIVSRRRVRSPFVFTRLSKPLLSWVSNFGLRLRQIRDPVIQVPSSGTLADVWIKGPIPYRITQGHHHRDEEEAFDDKTYDGCGRDHMALGNHVVQGVGASFEDLLQSLRTITDKYPRVSIKPIDTLRDITLHPFHLVNVNQRRGHHPNQQNAPQQPDPVSNQEVQEALRWLAEKCDWKPILAWDSMMCDVFPANLEPSRTFLPKADVLSRIQTMVSTLRSLNIPIRLSIGDRTNNCASSGLDGSLYFGDYKTLIGEGENRHEVLAPTQACFNLTGIAHMVDELTIQYPVDVPGIHGWLGSSKRPTPAEMGLLQREMKGWRRFWERYARQFKNLKKLTANVPNDIYSDWGKCEGFRELLSDERWQILEVEERGGDFGFFGSYFPFSSLRYSFSRRRPRSMKFVQRVFFREDQKPLDIAPLNPGLTEQEREEQPIPENVIADKELLEHRFWPAKPEKKDKGKGKRSADAANVGADAGAGPGDGVAKENGDAGEPFKKKRKVD